MLAALTSSKEMAVAEVRALVLKRDQALKTAQRAEEDARAARAELAAAREDKGKVMEQVGALLGLKAAGEALATEMREENAIKQRAIERLEGEKAQLLRRVAELENSATGTGATYSGAQVAVPSDPVYETPYVEREVPEKISTLESMLNELRTEH